MAQGADDREELKVAKKIIFVYIEDRWLFLHSFKRGVVSRFINRLFDYFFGNMDESERWKIVSGVANGTVDLESIFSRPSFKSAESESYTDTEMYAGTEEAEKNERHKPERRSSGLNALEKLRKRSGGFKR